MSQKERPQRSTVRLLSPVGEVRRGELRTALLLLVALLLVLFAYYLLKTLREPLVLASAAEDLALLRNESMPRWLRDALSAQRGPELKALAAGVQAFLLVALVPAFGWLANKVDRFRLIVGVTLFFAFNLELFYLASVAELPLLGFFFYAWVGVPAMAMPALFWSYANDLYEPEQGERLFPFVAIGATIGSPLGSLLADWLFALRLPTPLLFQAPVLIWAAFLALIFVINRRPEAADAREIEENSKKEHIDRILRGSLPPQSPGGFSLVWQSPYLRLVALLFLLANLVNTLGEFVLSDLVVDAARAAVDAGEASEMGPWIGSFYARFYLGVSALAFGLQILLAARIVRAMGLKGVLLALPFVALGAYGGIAAGVGLGTLVLLKTAENATDYSLMNTAKAMLWLRSSREEKYKAKQAVDTFFVRLGDLFASLLFLGGSLAFAFEAPIFGAINLGLVAIWLGVSFFVVRRYGGVRVEEIS